MSGVPTVCAPMELKVMVCGVLFTVKLRVTGVAAVKPLSPACEAVMLQLPEAMKVAVAPETCTPRWWWKRSSPSIRNWPRRSG